MSTRKSGIVALLPLALALAACGGEAPDDSNVAVDGNVSAAEAANAEIETLPPSETSDSADGPAPAGAGSIPAQFHGRWGMVAADCEPGRPDAKGLITIDETSLRFYESRAVLKQQRPAIATSFAGLFAFTGEGMNWEKVETLTRAGETLKRADDEGSYTYQQCA